LKSNLGKHKSEYSFAECLEESSRKNSLKPFIIKVRAEILCYPLYLSSNISVSTGIIESLGEENTSILALVCLSFIIAKVNDLQDLEELSRLVIVASSLDIGLVSTPVGSKQLLKERIANTFLSSKYAGVYLDRECKRLIFEVQTFRNSKKLIEHGQLISNSILMAEKILREYEEGPHNLVESILTSWKDIESDLVCII
jgi:hypothetical protein